MTVDTDSAADTYEISLIVVVVIRRECSAQKYVSFFDAE